MFALLLCRWLWSVYPEEPEERNDDLAVKKCSDDVGIWNESLIKSESFVRSDSVDDDPDDTDAACLIRDGNIDEIVHAILPDCAAPSRFHLNGLKNFLDDEYFAETLESPGSFKEYLEEDSVFFEDSDDDEHSSQRSSSSPISIPSAFSSSECGSCSPSVTLLKAKCSQMTTQRFACKLMLLS